MGTIPQYPAISTPNGGEQLAIWQTEQRQTTLSALISLAAAQSYASSAAGVAATFPGQTFTVPGDGGTVTFYLNAAGVAVEQFSFPNSAAMIEAIGAGLVGYGVSTTYPDGTVGQAISQLAISPILLGAKADAYQFTAGVISSGNLSQITLPVTPPYVAWAASTARVGNPICIVGAGPSGTPLVTTIAGVSSATITLTTPASQAVSGAIGDFGTDDTAAVQAAITLAEAIGGGVDFGGADNKYYIAGASEVYGTWSGGSFNRGSLLITGAVMLRGTGATVLLSGGRFNPGGIFYNRFWSTNSVIPGAHFDGLVIDCNMQAQYWAALPAGFTDGEVWQWGNAIALQSTRGLKVRNCVIRNVRGNGIGAGSYIDESGNVYQSSNTEISGCEFDNCFNAAAQVAAVGAWITQNYVHGDGYWVAAFDVESDAVVDQVVAGKVFKNIFDFRDGLSPVERTPAFATNSTDAANARIHLRRFVSAGGYSTPFPGGAWNGHFLDLTIEDNLVYQGVMDAGAFVANKIRDNTIIITAETITGNPHLIHYNPIIVSGGGNTDPTGLHSVWIENNTIVSPNPLYGIQVQQHDAVNVTGNTIVGPAGAGIRLENSSGHITNNKLLNVGSMTSGDVTDTAGIALFGAGTQPLTIADNHITDSRGTGALLSYGVYANVAISPLCVITGNVSKGFTPTTADGTYSPANNATSLGNFIDTGMAQIWSMPEAAKFGGPVSITGPVSIGDTSGSNDGFLTLYRGASGNSKIQLTDGAGIEYQIGQSNAAGLAMQNWSDGAYQWTDLAFSPTGQMNVNWTWQKPLLAGSNTYLWICQTSPNAGQCRKKIGSVPTSDTDGITGWAS